MKKTWRIVAIIFCICIAAYFAFGYINSYFGWYAYEHYKHRKGSIDTSESKRRGVFVKELKYKAEGFTPDNYPFVPFIEKAFTWGYHSSEETLPWTDTKFPYQINFGYRRSADFGVIVSDESRTKFDSSTYSLIYLRRPMLNDTIFLGVGGQNIPKGAVIKVFE